MMRFRETLLLGSWLIELEPHHDERGFFARQWCSDEFAARGLENGITQVNLAFNETRGTLRGMHFQVEPHAEIKLVRCLRGSLYDVVVDLRPDSATYLRWFGTELSATNRSMLYIPRGFAHGYLTLEDSTEVLYLVTGRHHPVAERGIRYDDPALGIDWPRPEQLIISAKDLAWPAFREDSLHALLPTETLA